MITKVRQVALSDKYPQQFCSLSIPVKGNYRSKCGKTDRPHAIDEMAALPLPLPLPLPLVTFIVEVLAVF